MARIEKVKQVLTENVIPDHAPAGTVFIAKDTQNVWLAVRSGEVLNLSDILDGKYAGVRTPARNGKDGKDGQSIRGERGEPGRDGVCCCKEGLDSTVPGPRGEVGPAGVGKQGPQGPPGTDTATVLADARAELAAVRAEFADLKLVVTAIHGQNKQCSEYISFLKARSDARKGK
jgi:hypothetical protein